jgi:hypothetical protein
MEILGFTVMVVAFALPPSVVLFRSK